MLHERVKLYKAWKDAEALLSKKKDERTKLEQQQKADRVAVVTHEISEVWTLTRLVLSVLVYGRPM